jgi:hypothetical protein
MDSQAVRAPRGPVEAPGLLEFKAPRALLVLRGLLVQRDPLGLLGRLAQRGQPARRVRRGTRGPRVRMEGLESRGLSGLLEPRDSLAPRVCQGPPELSVPLVPLGPRGQQDSPGPLANLAQRGPLAPPAQ